jgi:drug/metabolite transporter (DMT)-like permease
MNPIAAMILESFLRKKHYSWQSKVGVSLIFFGACITASGDLDFEIMGYSCAMLAVFGKV